MEDKGFKVIDKRIYGTGEGTTADNKVEAPLKDTPATADKNTSSHPLPPVDFSNLILSLSTSALIHLGQVPDPISNKTDKNIEMAKHTIDVIDMLKEKTKGNLTDNEQKLIDAVLFDLRMRYVNIAK